MPHPLQMFYGNLSQLSNKSNLVIRSRSAIWSKIGVIPDQWRVSLRADIICFERMVVEQWLEFDMKRDLKGFLLSVGTQ